ARPAGKGASNKSAQTNANRSGPFVAASAASEDGPIPALWEIVERVLEKRPELEAGKKIHVSLAEWMVDVPAPLPKGSSRNSIHQKDVCPSRALVNRALRHMSRLLPGIAWTVDLETQEVQVHLADVGRFSAFCDGR
ncbi:unnamed protein product, partial [Polarella glacialis]